MSYGKIIAKVFDIFSAITRAKLWSLLNYLNYINSLEKNQYLLTRCFSTLLINNYQCKLPYIQTIYQNSVRLETPPTINRQISDVNTGTKVEK